MAVMNLNLNVEPNNLISDDPSNVLQTGPDGRLLVPNGSVVAIQGPPGEDGTPGRDGVDGAPGTPGTDGTNGINGIDGQDGKDGIDGTPGEPGRDGTDGVGVPVGGTAGQVLAKKSNTDFDTEWVNPSGSGGGSSGVETIGVTEEEELLEISGTPTNAKIESTQELRNAVKKANSAQQEPYNDEWVNKAFANIDNSLHSISGIVSDVALDLDFAIQELETINEKIPNQASSENQLADKDFVNSSIQNMAANFVTPDALGAEIWGSLDLLRAGPWFFEGAPYSPTRNDYANFFDEEDGSTWRAKFSGTIWSPDFKINNSGFTAEQAAALNSGATEELIDKLANPDNVPTENSAELVKSGGVFAWFGAAVSTLQTTAKTVIGAINELYNDKLNKSGGTMTGAIAMGNNKITGLATPTATSDAAHKQYVDDKASNPGGIGGRNFLANGYSESFSTSQGGELLISLTFAPGDTNDTRAYQLFYATSFLWSTNDNRIIQLAQQGTTSVSLQVVNGQGTGGSGYRKRLQITGSSNLNNYTNCYYTIQPLGSYPITNFTNP